MRGHAARGTGLINNELYIGRLVWNRLRYIKDPTTGRRVSRLNPRDKWITTEVPELRIVDDELWQAAKAWQGELTVKYANVITATRAAHANHLNGTHRPRSLLSGLLVCGCCGGPYALRGQDRYACSNHVMNGSCSPLDRHPCVTTGPHGIGADHGVAVRSFWMSSEFASRRDDGAPRTRDLVVDALADHADRLALLGGFEIGGHGRKHRLIRQRATVPSREGRRR